MRNLDEMTITQAVLARNSGIGDARLCEIMTSLVQNLHAFARDIKLTETEWQRGIDFLAQAGAANTTDRQQFALISHVLGLSTLVLAQNDRKPVGCTETAAFHVEPEQVPVIRDDEAGFGADSNTAKGYLYGAVLDVKGHAIPHASVAIHRAYTHATGAIDQALLHVDERGRYHFCTALPDNQHIPQDGPAGQLLAALNRPHRRPAHFKFTVGAPGYQRLTTHVFREGDPYLDADPLFGVRSSLITEWQWHSGGMTPAGTVSNDPFYTLAFDFVLAKE